MNGKKAKKLRKLQRAWLVSKIAQQLPEDATQAQVERAITNAVRELGNVALKHKRYTKTNIFPKVKYTTVTTEPIPYDATPEQVAKAVAKARQPIPNGERQAE